MKASMSAIKARFPFKLGKKFVERGQVGRLALNEEIEAAWGALSIGADSPFLAVVFFEPQVVIVLRKQVEAL